MQMIKATLHNNLELIYAPSKLFGEMRGKNTKQGQSPYLSFSAVAEVVNNNTSKEIQSEEWAKDDKNYEVKVHARTCLKLWLLSFLLGIVLMKEENGYWRKNMSHPNCLVAAPQPPASSEPWPCREPLSLFLASPAQLECYHTVGRGGWSIWTFLWSDGESLKGWGRESSNGLRKSFETSRGCPYRHITGGNWRGPPEKDMSISRKELNLPVLAEHLHPSPQSPRTNGISSSSWGSPPHCGIPGMWRSHTWLSNHEGMKWSSSEWTKWTTTKLA